jgi:cell division septation protein DedD
MFNFVFDKRSLVVLVAGLTVAGGLLFFAGLLVGVNLGLPSLRSGIAYPPRPLPVRDVARPCPEPAVPAVAKPLPAPALEESVPAEPWPAPAPAPQLAEKEEPPPPARKQPARAVQAALRSPSEDGAYSVQVGAFRVKENSEAVMERLKSRGFEPYVVETPNSLHVVRIGRFAEREEALKIVSALKRDNMEAIVKQL